MLINGPLADRKPLRQITDGKGKSLLLDQTHRFFQNTLPHIRASLFFLR